MRLMQESWLRNLSLTFDLIVQYVLSKKPFVSLLRAELFEGQLDVLFGYPVDVAAHRSLAVVWVGLQDLWLGRNRDQYSTNALLARRPLSIA